MPDATAEMLGKVKVRREEVDRRVETVLQTLDDSLGKVGADEREIAAGE